MCGDRNPPTGATVGGRGGVSRSEDAGPYGVRTAQSQGVARFGALPSSLSLVSKLRFVPVHQQTPRDLFLTWPTRTIALRGSVIIHIRRVTASGRSGPTHAEEKISSRLSLSTLMTCDFTAMTHRGRLTPPHRPKRTLRHPSDPNGLYDPLMRPSHATQPRAHFHHSGANWNYPLVTKSVSGSLSNGKRFQRLQKLAFRISPTYGQGLRGRPRPPAAGAGRVPQTRRHENGDPPWGVPVTRTDPLSR